MCSSRSTEIPCPQNDVYRLIDGVNELHQRGQMSSQDQGWNVVHSLYKSLGISRDGYFGGEVILAPFDIETIAHIPKTVYAFNPDVLCLRII